MTNKDNRELGSTIQKTSAIIDEFKNLGYMRPNRFEMTINSPLSLPRVERLIQFHIQKVTYPYFYQFLVPSSTLFVLSQEMVYI